MGRSRHFLYPDLVFNCAGLDRFFDPSGSTLTFFPPFDSSEDAFGVSGPDEGFGIGVGFFDEPVDCSLKVGNRPDPSTLEAPSREFGEEAFDGVEPGRRGRREVKRPAGMPGPGFWSEVQRV